nr:hypothetical protein CFP56_21556 [Quercus suber]
MSEGILGAPAQEPQREHLDAPLSFKKKRSWMQSLREAVQKGALTAKANVDNFRGEPISAWRIETTDNGMMTLQGQSTKDRYMPKSAASSLRGHIIHHSKRPSVFSTVGRASMAKVSASAGLLVSTSDHAGSEDDPQENRQGKHNSITSSLAGSLRGLRRKTSHIVNTAYHERSPAQYPLPSSPVPIPVSALERLSLHFEPADFSMSPGFSGNIILSEEGKKLQGNCKPNKTSLKAPADAQPMQNSVFEAYPPSLGLLDVPRDSFELGSLERSPSPMPGTNLTLEVDGAHDEALHLFERSVMAKASRPELRPMRSLGAMAEACAMAHVNDGQASFLQLQHPTVAQNTQGGSLLQLHGKARSASNRAASTSSSFPSDMQQVSRQSGRENESPSKSQAGHPVNFIARDVTVFDAVASSGPSSPTRSVTLPFCSMNITPLNKIPESVDAGVFGALVDNAMNPKSVQLGTGMVKDVHLPSSMSSIIVMVMSHELTQML